MEVIKKRNTQVKTTKNSKSVDDEVSVAFMAGIGWTMEMDRKSSGKMEHALETLEWVQQVSFERLSGRLDLADKLSTLSAGMIALSASLIANSGGLAGWFLRISYLGLAACLLGFLLIRLGIQSIQGRLLKSAGVTKSTPAVAWLDDWRFIWGNRLLVSGFAAGTIFLAIYGLAK